MLVRCLYASRAATLTPEAIDLILTQSRKNNPRLGITGLLCLSDDVFIQVLEGGRDAVCDLYQAIVKDSRHTQVRMLVYEEITERRFGSWTMGHVNMATINPALLLKYFETAVLNPFNCSGQATMALLHELVASHAIVSRGS